MEAKTLGTNSLAGLIAAAAILGPLAYIVFPSKDQFTKLWFQVQLNQMRLDSAFGEMKLPSGFSSPDTSALPPPNVVYAAEEPQAQERLEAYRKALGEHAIVLPQSFIRKCEALGFWQDGVAGHKFKGTDGRNYSADQTVACIIRLMGYK